MNQGDEFSTKLALHDTVGWHMRPAGLLVSVANLFDSEIMVKCGQKIASAKSLLGVLTLGAGRGARLYVSARGHDAQNAIRAIREKFSSDAYHEVKAVGALSEPDKSKRTENPVRIQEGKSEMKMTPSTSKKPSSKVRVSMTFKCGARPDAKNVYLAGDFNGWDPQADPMTKRAGQFTKSVKLAPGKYHYKYVVDGEWHADPAAPIECSPMGSANNVICV